MNGLKFVSFVLLAAFCLGEAAPAFSDENTSRSILLAQNTQDAPADTVSLPNLSPVPANASPKWVQPKTAMYHSMTLPGWGQLDNGKRNKALLFIAAELAFIGGALYNQYRLSDDGLTSFEKDVTRTDRNSFLIYWFGARVFGLVDAYVDAHLKGFNTRDITPPGMERPKSDP
ncbi:MAG: DUF5683 domain-containing protein [Candidatus Latescibacterota bacterium]